MIQTAQLGIQQMLFVNFCIALLQIWISNFRNSKQKMPIRASILRTNIVICIKYFLGNFHKVQYSVFLLYIKHFSAFLYLFGIRVLELLVTTFLISIRPLNGFRNDTITNNTVFYKITFALMQTEHALHQHVLLILNLL